MLKISSTVFLELIRISLLMHNLEYVCARNLLDKLLLSFRNQMENSDE